MFRRIHLIDVENLCGDPRPSLDVVRAVRRRYLGRLRPGPGDLIVLACNHGAALEVGLGWPGVRLLLGSGPDGADNALLNVLAFERVDQRFDGVVIASGDSIFSGDIARIAGAGVRTFVVSRPETLAKRLRLAAQVVVELPAPTRIVEIA